MNSSALDNPETYKKLDPDNMLARIKELPSQCRRAWQAVNDFTLPSDCADVDLVVVLGMGGSAIGGDFIGSLVEPEAGVPVLVRRDYSLPAFVNDRTLVIASSYSGNTEETLSAFTQALKTGARKLAITTGGKLESLASEHNIPVFKIDYRAQPRAALGFSFLPALGILQKLGLVRDKNADVNEAVRVLEGLSAKIDESVPREANPAKKLAESLHGRLPVVYGAGIAADAARRWKTQLNENSKAWAFYEVFPELNHNAVVGLRLPGEIAGRIRVVMLRTSSFNERIRLRYEVTRELLDRAGVDCDCVDSEGDSPLAQMMSLVMFGDFASYYLALLYGVDPTPVEAINHLKERLARG